MARMLSIDADTVKKVDPSSNSSDPSLLNLNMASTTLRLLCLGIFFLFYLALGASVFSAIESPIERTAMDDLIKKKADFLQKHSCITDMSLEDLIAEIVEANNRGVSVGHNNSVVPSWSFGQSFFFSSTVVTTIGYGHQSPLSPEGKVFCIIYALLGIPMTMLLLTAVVERLMIPVNSLLEWLNAQLSHRWSQLTVRLVHLSLIKVTVVILLFLVPAAIFTGLEPHWNYLDSLYYCFISLTTIGLGDFIPGDTPGQTLRPLYKACTTFYLLIGVTAMMLTLTVFYSIPEFDISNFFLMSCSSNRMTEEGALSSGGNGGLGNASVGGHKNGDPERIRLNIAGSSGPKYTQQVDDTNELGHARTVVRARSRPNDDSPSPSDEGPMPGPSGRTRLR